MSIIRETFTEGRETDVPWSLSESKKKELKLEVAIHNMESMNTKEYQTLMPLQQICPTTGKVLHTFPSRLAAAKWIVENVLKNPKKNPISITGNMEMCMRGGWKSYGYYWKVCDFQKVASSNTTSSGQKVFVRKGGKDAVFSSITKAADFIGVKRKTLGARLKKVMTYSQGNVLVQVYNPEPKTITFLTVAEASKKTGIGEALVRKIILSGKAFNNYTLSTVKKYTPRYTLYRGTKPMGVYNTATEVSKVVEMPLRTVSRYCQSGKPFGILKYRVKKR